MLYRGTKHVSEEISQIQAAKEQQRHGLTMMEALKNLSRPDIRKPFILIAFNSAHCDFFWSLSNHLLLRWDIYLVIIACVD